jgi:hypothetical protein
MLQNAVHSIPELRQVKVQADQLMTQTGKLLTYSETTIMKKVLSSAAEAELGAIFHNSKKTTILPTTLKEMAYPQPATPMQMDNSTACGITNNTINQEQSQAIGMHFY